MTQDLLDLFIAYLDRRDERNAIHPNDRRARAIAERHLMAAEQDLRGRVIELEVMRALQP